MKKYKPYMRVGTGLWSLDKGRKMMEIGLLDALVAFLKEIFADYQLPAKSGLLQNVRVFAQYMPQPEAVEVNTDDEATTPLGYSATDIESNFPCVIVKLDNTTIREENTIDAVRINVRFLVCTYDESADCQGYRDVLNIIDKIKEAILTMQARVLARKYKLEMPLKSYLFEEQAWPIFLGQIETVWETGRPLMPNHPRCEIRF